MRFARLTRLEWTVLAVLVAWSLIPLVLALVDVWQNGGVISGGESFGVVDDYQYLAWVREMGEHGLASNLLDVEDDPRVYLHPMWLLSGLAWKAGLPIQAAFVLWKPVAVGVLAAGYVAYVRRMVAEPGRRALALALALLYLAPIGPLMEWLGAGEQADRDVAGLLTFELGPVMYAWGYYPTAIAVGLTPVFLPCLERALDPAGQRRRAYAVGAAAAGLVVGWVHPWQGLVLAALFPFAAVWARDRRRVLALALPAIATAAPIAYYFALSRSDTAWSAGGIADGQEHFFRWVALGLLPLAIPAAVGWWQSRRGRVWDLQEMYLVAWPAAALLAYAVMTETYIYHLLQGLALPLAILIARVRVGWRRPATVAAVAAALAAFTVPGAIYELEKLGDFPDHDAIAYRIRPGETDALDHIERSRTEGPVVSRFYLGQAVPAFTGRRTWVGHPSWTRDLGERGHRADMLLRGRATPSEARAVVRESGAAFVLADCDRRADLRPALGELVREVRHFGCATVYELRAG